MTGHIPQLASWESLVVNRFGHFHSSTRPSIPTPTPLLLPQTVGDCSYHACAREDNNV